jgi:VWFA-related protein
MSSYFQRLAVLPLILSISGSTSNILQSLRLASPLRDIQVDVDITLIDAAVTGRDRRSVPGLTVGNFRVWEDKVEQKIEYFSVEDVPATVALVLDVSGSMNTKSSLASEAASACLRTANRNDEYFLVEFDSKPHMVADFTHDVDLLEQRLPITQPNGSTALYDAVRFSLDKSKNGHQRRKALVLITDAQDNASRQAYLETIEYLKEQDAEIYR